MNKIEDASSRPSSASSWSRSCSPSFDDILDVEYAKLEDELDKIEQGEFDYVSLLKDFYKKFEKDLKGAKKEMPDLKVVGKATDLICDKCGSPMVIKAGGSACSSPARPIPSARTRRSSSRTSTGRGPRRGAARIAASRWW